ncbi:hypothetical protein MXB_3305, partial [Myxobolus squamalis]
MHTNIASLIMETVKSNKIDLLHEIEQKILFKNFKDFGEIFTILSEEKIDVKHRLRLFLLAYLNDVFSQSGIEKVKTILELSDIHAFKYLCEHKNVVNMTTQTTTTSMPTTYGSVFSKLVAQSPHILAQGVRHFVTSENNLPLTRLLQSLLENRISDQCELLTLDPLKPNNSQILNQHSPVSEIIVYVVGGGCFSEYRDVMSLLNKKQFVE